MKILQRGNLPSEATYIVSCRNCQSVLEYTRKEARVVSDRNETCYVIECPVCKKEIWTTDKSQRG